MDCTEGHYDVECVCILILIFSGFVNVSVTGLGGKKKKNYRSMPSSGFTVTFHKSQMMTLAGNYI